MNKIIISLQIFNVTVYIQNSNSQPQAAKTMLVKVLLFIYFWIYFVFSLYFKITSKKIMNINFLELLLTYLNLFTL